MKRYSKVILQNTFFILFAVSLWACGPPLIIPKSTSPAQIYKTYRASFEKTWDAVIDHIKSNKDILINEDKNSGTITFKSSTSDRTAYLYANVYIKRGPNDEFSSIYFRPWVAFPKSERNEEIVSIRPSVTEQLENQIFAKLDKSLGEN